MKILDAVRTHARACPDAPACVDLDSGRRWSYGELDLAVDRAATWLVARLGAASGARVATLARNRAEMLLLNLACVRAGAIFVPFNWRLSAPEVAALLADAEPSILFYDSEFDLPDFGGEVHQLCDLVALTQQCPPLVGDSARRTFDDVSTLLYTSGTSGAPKGVMLSENNVFWSNLNFNLGNGVCAQSVFLCDMPLFHTAGLVTNARAPLLAGASVLISGGFNAGTTLQRLADPGLAVSHYFSVPQMAQRLWHHPDFAPQKLQGLQVYATGGAPNPAAQIARFVNAGIPMSDGFGMTETGSNFGMPVSDRQRIIDRAGSCGLPYIGLEVRIADAAGEPVAAGETGELWLRGPGISRGYWNRPELTAEVFADDWFRTGDIARVDGEGFCYIVDRKKDMFISGGENVYPAEVEATILQLPAVAEAAVVGVPDATWGETGVAFVVAAGAEVCEEEIRNHCRERLARYKVPKDIFVIDQIPRTGSGKALKPQLIELARALGIGRR